MKNSLSLPLKIFGIRTGPPSVKPYWFHLKGSLAGPERSEGIGIGVHLVVAEELEERAVILVRAGLGQHVDLGGLAAELGRIDAGLHLEFLQRVDRRHDHEGVEIRVGVLDAIERVVVEVGALAGHRNGLGRADAALPRAGLPLTREAGRDVRRQRNQLQIVAPVQRQFHDALVLDDRADGRVFGDQQAASARTSIDSLTCPICNSKSTRPLAAPASRSDSGPRS